MGGFARPISSVAMRRAGHFVAVPFVGVGVRRQVVRGATTGGGRGGDGGVIPAFRYRTLPSGGVLPAGEHAPRRAAGSTSPSRSGGSTGAGDTGSPHGQVRTRQSDHRRAGVTPGRTTGGPGRQGVSSPTALICHRRQQLPLRPRSSTQTHRHVADGVNQLLVQLERLRRSRMHSMRVTPFHRNAGSHMDNFAVRHVDDRTPSSPMVNGSPYPGQVGLQQPCRSPRHVADVVGST